MWRMTCQNILGSLDFCAKKKDIFEIFWPFFRDFARFKLAAKIAAKERGVKNTITWGCSKS